MVAKDRKKLSFIQKKPDSLFIVEVDIYKLMLSLLSAFSRICKLANNCESRVFDVLQFNQKKSMA